MGLPGLETAQEMALRYRRENKGTIRERANALIRAHNVKAGTQVGGL